MHDSLKFREVCARWVSRELKDRDKMNGMGVSLQHLLRYAVHLFRPRSLRLRHQLGRILSLFSEGRWKCEFCIVLWSSV
jgi:hypothetical protein